MTQDKISAMRVHKELPDSLRPPHQHHHGPFALRLVPTHLPAPRQTTLPQTNQYLLQSQRMTRDGLSHNPSLFTSLD